MWPGFSVFYFDAIDSFNPDFLPVVINGEYLDAGGDYPCLYTRYSDKDAVFAKSVTKRVQNTASLHSYNDIYHRDCIQVIDRQWVHLVNGSDYAKVGGGKLKIEMVKTKLREMEFPYVSRG